MGKHRLTVVMNEDLRDEMDRMADELGMSKNHLALLALNSLVANYEKSGSFIFVDLLNPKHKEDE